MFKYLSMIVVAAVVIYASMHPEMLGLSDPTFKVWVDQPFSGAVGLDKHIRVLNVQSREDKPIVVNNVMMNDDPKCVNSKQPQSFEQPMKLGQVLKFTLLVCNPVKVLVSTERGKSVYHFN